MAAAAGEQTGETDPELLKVAISNEKGAPELLEYQEELVRRLQDKLRECETRVQALDQQKAALVGQEGVVPREVLDLEQTICAEDVARLKFLIKEFLRTRLSKIQAFALHLLDSPERVARMSEAELAFAQQLSVLTIRHMTDNILAFLPDRFQDFFSQRRDAESPGAHDMVPRPDLDRYVFVQAMEDCEVEAGLGDRIRMSRGDLIVFRYAPKGVAPDAPTVQNLLRKGIVRLV